MAAMCQIPMLDDAPPSTFSLILLVLKGEKHLETSSDSIYFVFQSSSEAYKYSLKHKNLVLEFAKTSGKFW